MPYRKKEKKKWSERVGIYMFMYRCKNGHNYAHTYLARHSESKSNQSRNQSSYIGTFRLINTIFIHLVGLL